MWPELYNGPWFKETCIKVCWFKKKIGLLQMQKLHYKLRYLVILLHMIKSFFLVYSHNKMFYKIYYNICAFLNLYPFIYHQDRQGWMERSVITLRKTRWIFLSELTQGESQTLKWSRSVLPQCVTELASKVQCVSWFILLLNKYIIKINCISYYSRDYES